MNSQHLCNLGCHSITQNAFVLLWVCTSTISPSVHAQTAPPQACATLERSLVVGPLALIKSLMVKDRHNSLREGLRLPRVDSNAVQPVQSEEICRAAVRALNRAVGSPDALDRVVYVVRVGSVYWVEDPTLKAGEYTRAFVFDKSLTTVLSRPSR